jgi:hypothetical protein
LRPSKRTKRRYQYRQVTGTKTVYLGRKGKVIGESKPQPAPKVNEPKPDWNRRDYHTCFDMRAIEGMVGRLQFQRNMRTGKFSINYYKKGFNATFLIEEKGRENLRAFLEYADSLGIRPKTTHTLLFSKNVIPRAIAPVQTRYGNCPTYDINVIRLKARIWEQDFKAHRRRYLSSLHSSVRKRKRTHK